VRVGPELNETYAGLSGSAAARDMESLFQLVNLYFASPYFTEAAWKRAAGNISARIEANQKYPQNFFWAELRKVLYPGSMRMNEADAAFTASLDDAGARQFYRQFYDGAGNFTFVFTGNISIDEVKRLSVRYLASLPAGESAEARDALPAFPKGKQVVRIK
jgi:zinc protease